MLAPLVTAAWQTIPSDGATLDLSLDEYRIDADERRLRQLFENLLANAVDHGGPGVTVHVGVLDDGTGFFVADDGPGIPPVAREEVFEYGYSTSDGHPGFGLAIVRSIAEAHGWTVSATESAAGGAQFDVGVSQTGQSSEAGQSPA